MGLRCLLGHEYGNREVEREREERGEEVVVTYRTVETCERCGERRTVSENKEVRPVRDPDEEGETMATGLGPGGVTPDPSGVAEDAADGDAPEVTTAEASTPSDPAADPIPDAEGGSVDDAGDEGGAGDDDVEESPDDGIILDTPDDGRGHGEWPDPDDIDADDGTDPDDVDVDDGATVVSGDDAWPGEATAVESDGGGSAAVSVAGGPAAGDTAADGSEAGQRFVAADADAVEVDADETEFFCPNCGHARAATGSSMRVGDICPSCHRGYVAERGRQ